MAELLQIAVSKNIHSDEANRLLATFGSFKKSNLL